MRTAIKTTMLIAVLALLGTSCTADATDEAAAAEPTTTVATTTTTEPPPDPAEKAAATQQASIDAFLAQDIDAFIATHTEDTEFFNRSMSTHWAGEVQLGSNMMIIFNMTDPDATEVLEHFVSEDGTRGVILWHWVGENGKGHPIDLMQLQLQEYTDGLISMSTSYWEDQDVRDQLMAGYGS